MPPEFEVHVVVIQSQIAEAFGALVPQSRQLAVLSCARLRGGCVCALRRDGC